ncbi:DUF2523 family protein [Luteimonas sp. 22616]|uniref:DUF2523 family protein n=1 Tax=Luteimonas sp. 22616 TaxID=3453951 RepID=UPI003F87248D
MPAILAALFTGLRWLILSKLGLFLATALLWLGINFGTMKLVLQPTLDLLTNFASGGGTGGGEYWIIARQWAGVLNFDKALTMVISAYVTQRTLMAGRLFMFKRGIGAG